MSLARASRQYLGVRALPPPDLQTATRDPTTADKAYVKGTLWLNRSTPAAFMYSGAAGLWIAMGSGTTGGVVTINSNAPVAGNYVLAGTANQIAIGQTAGTSTFTIPAPFIAPGSIASTTTITSGTAMVATTTVTAGTSITATLGNITATNGNLVLTAPGNKMIRTSVGSGAAAGANSIGTATLIGGTITISTTALTASSLVRVWRESVGATGAAATGNIAPGTRTAGVSFVINSVSAADATALATTDVSVVGWEIIN